MRWNRPTHVRNAEPAHGALCEMHMFRTPVYFCSSAVRISIQTAGLAFGGTGLCSYRVRGVDGSCAKHSTVESYMVIYAANSPTYYCQFSITHSLFHSRLKTSLFCKSFPLKPFLFFFRTDYMIPQTFTVTSSLSVFTF